MPRSTSKPHAPHVQSRLIGISSTHSLYKKMAASTNGGPGEKTYFEQQRELLIGDIANVRPSSFAEDLQELTVQQSLENVLQNINKLNRGLESVIAVCVDVYR